MNSCELTLAITALANSLSQYLSNDELSLLSVILTQLADTLETIATKKEICEKFNNLNNTKEE